jgi:hypothetical protein
MYHPSHRCSPALAVIVALLAGASVSCARSGVDGPTALGAPAIVADGPSRVEVALITIDTDATVPLSPGRSVGLFVQHAAGGHWNLSTTCDTRLSGQPCAFDIVVSPAPGASFSAVMGLGLSRDDTLDLRPDGSVHLLTSTTYGTDGISFDSDPGATVDLDALLDGVEQPRLVHLVSDGSVVEGVPTNPVTLEPSAR